LEIFEGFLPGVMNLEQQLDSELWLASPGIPPSTCASSFQEA